MKFSSRKIKSLILKALPYVIFAYAGNKIGYAYCTADGENLSEKLLPFFNNIGTSFTQVLPSFHVYDILTGVAAAVLMGIVMYMRSLDRKKFRNGEEYGSARWGAQKDIEPYMDNTNFFNNVILTMTEFLTMGKSSTPKYARNKNILVIGGSGSGKTRFFFNPNLMQIHSSYVVIDPKCTMFVGYTITLK